ncbi:capsular polysaccharide synthesis protein [Pedobacter sp. V48]|uniref:capsular polysaccharide synthesis protein n=1 Tax=Pedobacter sp. V48 TaxID=509635 RepID=UPI0003E56C1F|nr:capsular polysaccharide synthesis protein [Pedobacter sp. V48]ETZ22029.1 hypothetical protein N824_24205 [Pedobacter sp. V48]
MANLKNKNLPVWLYWEGELPDWIKACQKTVFAHVNNVQLLTPESFNELRDVDLDIKISDLYVAHRADFIRAFLLKKFGGLWVDSDCVVIKPLQPLMDILNMYEFMGYRERSGEVTNNFMGASFNSDIASGYYNRVCQILRSGQPIEWLTIGSQALTATLNEGKASWYELKVEQIQPICWSNPSAFFQRASDDEHQNMLNPSSYCYMVSANMVRGYLEENQYPNILDNDTFFSYLLRTSEASKKTNSTLLNR